RRDTKVCPRQTMHLHPTARRVKKESRKARLSFTKTLSQRPSVRPPPFDERAGELHLDLAGTRDFGSCLQPRGLMYGCRGARRQGEQRGRCGSRRLIDEAHRTHRRRRFGSERGDFGLARAAEMPGQNIAPERQETVLKRRREAAILVDMN